VQLLGLVFLLFPRARLLGQRRRSCIIAVRGWRSAANTRMSQAASASTGMTAMRASSPAESAEFGYGLTESSRYG
jgi:hypothetical protein